MAKKNQLPFDVLAVACHLPRPELEYKFHDTRKWRFDLAWVKYRVAVEVHGSVWVGGRHTRGAGFINDREKMNAAIECGWVVLEYVTGKIDFDQVGRVLKGRGWKGSGI